MHRLSRHGDTLRRVDDRIRMTTYAAILSSAAEWPPARRRRAPQAAGERPRSIGLATLGSSPDPVLRNLAAGTLKRRCRWSASPGIRRTGGSTPTWRRSAACSAGIAPWLEAPLDPGPERELQQTIRELAREPPSAGRRTRNRPTTSISTRASQPLVDCGFLGAGHPARAQRACGRSWTATTQQNLAAALVSSRVITPGFNNWLLFSATVEAALALMGERWDGMRIDYAVRAAPAVVRGRRRVRRRPAVPLGLLQQLRHSAHAAGRAARHRGRTRRPGTLAAGHAGAGEAVRRHPGAPDFARRGRTRRSAGRSRTVAARFRCWRRWRCWRTAAP